MYRVLECLTTEHDLRLVLLAAAICLIAVLTSFQIFDRARGSKGTRKAGWLFLTGVSTGAGIWATHFVAMLAYDPSLPVSYEPLITGVSLMIAVIATTMGFSLAGYSRRLPFTLSGGAIVGAAIASMHYKGMQAFQVPGRVDWDMSLVAASLVMGIAFSMAAFSLFERVSGKKKVLVGAGLLTLAICGLHFTAMGAAIVSYDPTIFVVPAVVDNNIMAMAVAAISLIVIFAGVTAVLIDGQTARESIARSQELVDAALEGIIICQNGVVRNVNSRFCQLSGHDRDDLLGVNVWDRILMGTPPDSSCEVTQTEATLKTGDGDEIPVEVVNRPYLSDDSANEVYAIRDLRERHKAEQRIRFLAHNDVLTGLPNRTSLNRELDRLLRENEVTREPFAVMCLDLDRFKDVNDVLGHAAGDAALADAGRRMIAAVGDQGYLARAGGDEFVVLQSGHSQPDGISALSTALQDAFNDSIEVDSQLVQLGVSTGVALFPNDGETAGDLLSKADSALYRAKANGRGQSCFFESDMDELQRRRRKLAQALSTALENDEFTLNYQPQVQLPTADLIGFEALVRWQHPEHGTVSPADFIPIAEETGMILKLGEWVMRTACAEAASWNHDCKVAVNLSPKQFQQKNLTANVIAILEETGLQPNRLELEITETTLFEDRQRALRVLRELKELGVSIAMDDFGTGYSSLSTLQAFPFDKIKIDRSFVSGVENVKESSAIVRSVLGLGKSLDIPVLAEGVETQDELEFLTRENCASVQGYYFGRPESPEHVRKILASGSLLQHCLDRMKDTDMPGQRDISLSDAIEKSA